MGTRTVHETLGDWSDGFGFLSCPNLEFYTKPNHPSNTKRKQHLQTWNFQVSDPSVHPSFRKLLNNMFQQNKREVWDRGRETRQNPEAGGRAKTRWQRYRSLKVNHFGLEGEIKTVRRGPERKNGAERMYVITYKGYPSLGVWVHTCYPNPQEAEARACSKPSRTQSETLSQK